MKAVSVPTNNNIPMQLPGFNSESHSYTNDGLEIPTEALQHYKGINSKGNEVWEVERVLKKKVNRRGKPLWYVKWKGWPVEECTWEPRSSFYENPDVLLHKNMKRRKPKVPSTLLKQPTVFKQRRKPFSCIKDATERHHHSNVDIEDYVPPLSTKRRFKDSDTLSRNTISTEETVNQALSFKSNPSEEHKHLIRRKEQALADSQEIEKAEWSKNEVRVAVQRSSCIVIPSDTHPLYLPKKTFETASETLGTEELAPKELPQQKNVQLLSSDILSRERCEDEYWFRNRPCGDGYFDNSGIDESNLDFLGASFPINDVREKQPYLLSTELSCKGISQKRVCKEQDKLGNEPVLFKFTVQRVDFAYKRLEVVCSYKSNNEHFYTKWLNIDQLSKICPTQALDFLMKVGTQNLLLAERVSNIRSTPQWSE